jgi:hypothetical protein
MAQRHQGGWLKKEMRAQGETWVLFFRTTRKSDGKRVENKIPIGLVQGFPDEKSARAEVERLHVPINRVDMRRGLTFGDLAQHYAEHELVEGSESIRPKAHTTIKGYERVLRNPPAPTMGEQNRTWHRTVGSGAVAEGLEKGRTSCQSHTRQDSSRHVLGVQAWPKIRSTSAKPGVEPHALCPLQDNQRIRSDDSHPRTGVCNRV